MADLITCRPLSRLYPRIAWRETSHLYTRVNLRITWLMSAVQWSDVPCQPMTYVLENAKTRERYAKDIEKHRRTLAVEVRKCRCRREGYFPICVFRNRLLHTYRGVVYFSNVVNHWLTTSSSVVTRNMLRNTTFRWLANDAEFTLARNSRNSFRLRPDICSVTVIGRHPFQICTVAN